MANSNILNLVKNKRRQVFYISKCLGQLLVAFLDRIYNKITFQKK